MDKSNHQGKGFECYVFATQCAEVEVDVETGEYTVLQLAAAHDVGRAINPMNVEGQIEGGSSMGYGLGMMEAIRMKNGKVQNPSFLNYNIPTSLDAPCVRFPSSSRRKSREGPTGSRAWRSRR